jgi:hypothetical protein
MKIKVGQRRKGAEKIKPKDEPVFFLRRVFLFYSARKKDGRDEEDGGRKKMKSKD